MNTAPTYQVKSPTGLIHLSYLSFLTCMLAYMTMRGFFVQWSEITIVVLFGLTALSLYVLGVSCYRTFKKPFDVRIETNLIVINDKQVDIEHIDEILIQGYWKPVIGIRIKGHRIVQAQFCYRYMEEEDDALKALYQWAHRNHVKVSNRPFIRWI